ncbi:ATP-binding cassette domain-containing protein [Rhizohabitans arisaemae]|uniref:ATP-binding cassette domain-containing protein n=1 Tax=Rhizohabitans arisaemae TaxID=2720610 RepID=UPI0024B282EF|nr:ABC transporter ATP-binding protein [Rhizohabitans arisaemae]
MIGGLAHCGRILDIVITPIRRRPSLLVPFLLWSTAEALPAFTTGHAVARAVDDGFAAGRPLTGLGWLAVLGASWAVAAVGARQILLLLASVVEPFRDDLLSRIVGGTLSRAGTPGDRADTAAVSRMSHQVELARDSYAAVITVVRTFVFTLVSVVLGLLTLMPEVLVLVLPPFLVGLVLFLASLPALAGRQRAFILADENTAESVATMVAGLRDITACGAADRTRATVGSAVRRQARAAHVLARLTAVRTLALAVGGWLPVLLLLAGTPWLIREGAGPGVILGALAFVMQSLTPTLGSLVQGLGVSGVRLAVTLDRILETECRPASTAPSTALSAAPDGSVPVGAAPRLELRGVVFAYGAGAEPVVSGLDLTVHDGDHIAVVGPSGIGKSTLAALIAGVLRPQRGEILVDGSPTGPAMAHARVLIPQQAYVFRGSLAENLLYHAPGTPAPAIERAAEAVGGAELVRRLGGLHAQVDPGALSAGERQLIALVRAYLAPARLVVLDEATCHLDPAAEARAEEAFARRGGALIVIAHRLTSAARARHILVMDGTRVSLGVHERLISESPLYADLVGHWRTASPSPA